MDCGCGKAEPRDPVRPYPRNRADRNSALDIMVVKPHVADKGAEMVCLHEMVGDVGTGVDVLVWRLRGVAEANLELSIQNIKEPYSAVIEKRFLAALGTGSAISSILLKISDVKSMRLLRFARNDIVARN